MARERITRLVGWGIAGLVRFERARRRASTAEIIRQSRCAGFGILGVSGNAGERRRQLDRCGECAVARTDEAEKRRVERQAQSGGRGEKHGERGEMKSQVLRFIGPIVLGLCLLGTTSAWAQQSDDFGIAPGVANGIAWGQLSADQQQILASVQGDWHRLPPARQVALANGAKRFIGMNAEQRAEATRRFTEWRKLSDGERAEIRGQLRMFRGLSPLDKARLRQAKRRFNRLNQDQRERMRERFRQLTPEQHARLREQIRERQRPTRRN